MSQLVIEMNMPTSCLDCPCRGFDGFGQKAYCTLSLLVKGTAEGRPQTCPIIAELPPHGRLIDADALRKEAGKLSREDNDYYLFEEHLLMALEKAPTILESNRRAK